MKEFHFYCDICGCRREGSERRINWLHQVVCTRCWQRKPPGETPPKPVADPFPVKNARPEPDRIDRGSGLTWEAMFLNWEDITTNWEDLK